MWWAPQKKIKYFVSLFSSALRLWRYRRFFPAYPQVELSGEGMYEESIHIVVTAGIIALMFAWVPILGAIFPPAWKPSERPCKGASSQRKRRYSARSQPVSVAPLRSPRFSKQSREILEALSSRGERESSRSQAVSPRVPASSCAQRLGADGWKETREAKLRSAAKHAGTSAPPEL